MILIKKSFIKYFLMFFVCLSEATAAQNHAIINQLSDYVAHHQQEQLSLLEKLVNINSGTDNITGVERVGELLRSQFQQLGFTVQWIKEPPSMHKAATLVAQHHGTKGKRLLLIGHLDTVFPSKSPFQLFTRDGKKAIGPGVIDDKGGDVVILYALKALAAANILKDASIIVVLTGDEEESGKPTSISRKPLFNAARNSDIALDFEPAASLHTLAIARRGISNWKITADGSEAHSSEIFKQNFGFGAVYEIARIVDHFRNEFSHEKYLTVNPGLILGGTKLEYDKLNSQGQAFGKENVISNTSLVTGDIRFISNSQKIKTISKMKSIVQQHLANTSAAISFQKGIPAMPATIANVALLKLYSQVSVSLGCGVVTAIDPGEKGAGDISHIAALVAAGLVGLGPVGNNAHSEKETLDVASLSVQTKRAAVFMYTLMQ